MAQLSLIANDQLRTESPPVHLLSVVVPPLDGEFLYSYDPGEQNNLSVGSIVTVPLGKRLVPAFVISIDSESEAKSLSDMQTRNVRVKPIDSSAPCYGAFTREHLEFYRWIAKYYAEPLSKILDLAVPTPSLKKPEVYLRVRASTPVARIGASQKQLVDALASNGNWVAVSDLRKRFQASAATIRALLSRGIVEERSGFTPEEQSNPDPSSLTLRDTLTPEQLTAVDAVTPNILQASYAPFLLHGVTGSGKTEVYLELIVEALKLGRSALVVVPEIALTPQLIDRFEARLKQRVSLLHSSLKAKDRWQNWADLINGTRMVAIGARSAIFAPMKNLGLIIVDEEHDASFKQAEGIRYNGRDLALVRAKLHSCPVVLGSATPSLESFYNAHSKRYSYLPLRDRFHNAPPLTYELIDLNRLKPWEMPSKSISPQMLQRITETLRAGEQSFILYNRRGFASYLQCSSCEQVVGCPHCSVTLTYHRKNNSLLCHFCGFSTPPPVVCSGCGAREVPSSDGTVSSSPFSHRGAGTERVSEELQTLLPDARIAKLDRDSVHSIDDYIEILRRVRSREVDILVGTQMIAKGHDLPDVTFVGIVDCDVGLHIPDFRASERSFQHLTQAAGRAGRRGKQGRVVLQTRVPSHASLQQTVRHDFTTFAEIELKLRKTLDYPPFQRLLRIIIASEDKGVAQQWAQVVAAHTAAACGEHTLSMLGPAPAPLEKIRNHWRYHILCKGSSASVLQNVMQRVKASTPENRKIRLIFDLDPQDML
jgi:primosomal protein N' (replication factor Y)